MTLDLALAEHFADTKLLLVATQHQSFQNMDGLGETQNRCDRMPAVFPDSLEGKPCSIERWHLKSRIYLASFQTTFAFLLQLPV